MSTDVNGAAVTEEDLEWMDGAKSTFAKMEDLAPSVPPNFGPGRLVAIWAQKNGERKNDSGQVYGYTETVTVVLDDGPDGDLATDLVGPAPQRLDGLQHSTTGLHTRLKPRVTGVNTSGVPLRFRPVIGRINTQASRMNKNVAAYSIAEPTASDMAIARSHKDLIVSINKELEQAENQASDSEAFE